MCPRELGLPRAPLQVPPPLFIPRRARPRRTCPKKTDWLASWQSTMESSHARSVRKRSNSESSAHAPAGCITPQQKQTLEEALVTVASWDRLMGTEAEEEGEATALSAALAFLRNQSWWPRPKESVNLPLFIRASQECVTPPSQTGRRLSHGSPPSPSKARTPNSPASPAIILQRQWLAAMLKIAEADDLSWGGRLLRGDDLLSITPPEDLKQRGAQQSVSPGRQARVYKLHAVRRLELEQPPAHQTQAVETGTWPWQQPSSKLPWQPLKPVATHTHRAGWGQAVCLLAAALILSAVAQARAPERRGRQVVRAAYHRRRRRSAQRPGRAAAVQRGEALRRCAGAPLSPHANAAAQARQPWWMGQIPLRRSQLPHRRRLGRDDAFAHGPPRLEV